MFFSDIFKGFCIVFQQNHNFLQQLDCMSGRMFVQKTDHCRKAQQVTGISTGKGDAFAAFGGHIQGVVPIGSPKSVDIMVTYLVKGCQLLDEKMF